MLGQKIKKITDQLYGWLSSGWFLLFSVGLFIAHCTWLVLSANLLPYDEYFHIGIIKYYSHQWSPFISTQDYSARFFGDITRLPSYMYHYLMSFPYRFVDLFTDNEQLITIVLRFINVGLVIIGVLIFRWLFIKKANLSKRLVNVVTTIFLLSPITVMLASQNNYDNLMFLLTPITVLFALKLIEQKKLSLISLLTFISLGLFTSLVKHSSMVVFLGLTFFVAYRLWVSRASRLNAGLKQESKLILGLICILTILVTGLFVERHILNIVRYKEVAVSCIKVQPLRVCKNYSPWNRNNIKRNNPPQTEMFSNVGGFGVHWVATMMSGLYPIYAQIPHNIGTHPDPYGDYVFKPRLPILLITAYSLLVVGIVTFILKIRTLLKQPLLLMLILTALILATVLFIVNYKSYLDIKKPYAIQVRYLLPMILPIMVIIAQSMKLSIKSSSIKKYATLAILILYIWCGGVVGWILKSDDNWYWSNNLVLKVNHEAKSFLKIIVPD